MLTSVSARPRAGVTGFNLVELMVALALLGFLLLLGLPAFTTMVSNTRIRTVADALQNGLRLARSEALRLNQATVFVLTDGTPALNVAPAGTGRNWWVQTIPRAGGDAASPVPNGSGALTDVASGISITGPAVVCFNANGRISAVAAPIATSSSACSALPLQKYDIGNGLDRPLRVEVSVGGLVHMCDPKRPLMSASAASFDGCSQ